MSDDLKPCPFCGGAFKIGQEPHGNYPVSGLYYIYHDYGPLGSVARKCVVSVYRHFETKAEAIAAWNNRAPDPRIEALERERDEAYAKGYGDCENETSLTEIGKTNEFLHGQIAKYRAALTAMTKERDVLQESRDEAVRLWSREETLREMAEARLAKAVEALRDMCAEFRGHDLPYGSKAYAKATATLAELEGKMSDDDMIDLEVQMIHRAMGIAILSDGQEVPITNWIDIDGDECDYADAVACACGPDFDGKYYAVALGSFVEEKTQ